jgi:NTP pyrophosphatase (non-canonical NTP hydrolase)
MNPDEIDVYLKMRDRCEELEHDNILQHEHILELEKENSELSDTIHKMHDSCKRAVKLRKLLDEFFDIGRDEAIPDDEIRKRMKNLKNEIAQLRKENCQIYDQRNQLADEKKQQADYILELRTELERLREAARNTQKRTEVRESYIQELENAFARMSETAKASAEKIKALNDSIDQLRDECSKQKEENRCSCINASEAALKDAEAKIQSANDRAANAKKEAKEAKERAESASERIRYLERKLRDVESLNDSLMKELARRQGCQADIREHDADIYQLDVLKYAPDYQHYMPNVLYAAIGICGEAGEVSELVKKYAYHGHAMDTEHLARELGDVLWYVSYMAHLFGYSLGEIMAMNQEKLAKRYPDGKFDEERSRNRKEGDI